MGKKATNIISIFIYSTSKSDPLRDTHIVLRNETFLQLSLLNPCGVGWLAKYILKNETVLLN